MRLSEEEKEKLPKEEVWHEEEGVDQLVWLYLTNIEEDMKRVLEN